MCDICVYTLYVCVRYVRCVCLCIHVSVCLYMCAYVYGVYLCVHEEERGKDRELSVDDVWCVVALWMLRPGVCLKLKTS